MCQTCDSDVSVNISNVVGLRLCSVTNGVLRGAEDCHSDAHSIQIGEAHLVHTAPRSAMALKELLPEAQPGAPLARAELHVVQRMKVPGAPSPQCPSHTRPL